MKLTDSEALMAMAAPSRPPAIPTELERLAIAVSDLEDAVDELDRRTLSVRTLRNENDPTEAFDRTSRGSVADSIADQAERAMAVRRQVVRILDELEV